MKKLTTLLAAAIFTVGFAFAQAPVLKGPKAKNAHPGQSLRPTTTLQIASSPAEIKGPKGKNQQSIKTKENQDFLAVNTTAEEIVKGPKGKNKVHAAASNDPNTMIATN
jgi:hypothetical protein